MTARGERRLGDVVGGKYRIGRFLASGGMGAVYEAQHTLVKRRFAVKFLHPDLARKRELLARFQREAEAAGALESENVAATVDLGIANDGSPYIVMEYLVGESLERLLAREGTLPVERATELVQQACRGVSAAHALGIVHRDLKPQNLFVCRREDRTDLLKVLDFGVAKLGLGEPNSAATRTGSLLGTPSYMAPEQARGEKGVGHAVDVYALGAILYELVSGKKPHPGESHNAVLHHIATQPAVPLASVREGLPEGLVAVVEQALSSSPEARPPSADALARALAPWVERKSFPPPPEVEPSVSPEAEPSNTELAPAHAASAQERPSRAPSLAVASLERERTRAPTPPLLFVALAGAAILLSFAVFWARTSALKAGAPVVPVATAVRAAEPGTLAEPPVPAPETPPSPPAASPPQAQAPSDARVVVPSQEAPGSVHRARRAAGSDAPARPSVVTKSAVSAASAAPAAPVVFDQKNPYH